MPKKSQYLIFQSINENKEMLLFSTKNKKLLKVSNEIGNSLKENKINEINEHHISRLIEYGMLVDIEVDETKEIIDNFKYNKSQSDSIHFDISPSSYCQMGCDYCGQIHTKDKMTEELELKVFKRIQRKVYELNPKHIDVTWFGAEPLTNLVTIKYFSEELISFLKENNIDYSANIITNGLLLTEDTYKILLKSKVSDIQVTLDGDEKNHNQSRFLKTGKGTFRKIYENIQKLCFSDIYKPEKCAVTIRANIDKRNREGIYRLFDKLEENNLHKKVNFYPTFVHPWENDVSAIELDRAEYAAWEIEMFAELIERGFNISEYLLPTPIQNTCMATSEHSELYSADGQVFNCTEMFLTTNEKKNTLGNLLDNQSISSERPFSDWFDIIQENNDIPCNTCEFLPSCGGHCPKHWLEGHRPCPGFKFNMRERMQLYYYQQLKNNATIRSL